MKKTISLPDPCDLTKLIELLKNHDLLDTAWEALLIEAGKAFVTTDAMAFLCSWGQKQIESGRKIDFKKAGSSLTYLSRMNLFQHLGVEFTENFQRHEEEGRFFPIELLKEDDDLPRIVGKISEVVRANLDNAGAAMPCIHWTMFELLENILLHAEATTPGVVCAQFYPQNRRMELAIFDMGRGLKASLEEGGSTLWSHGEAITTALQQGQSRTGEKGRGNGLTGTHEIVRLNGGSIEISTGNVIYDSKKPPHKRFSEFSNAIPGTGLHITFRTDHPIEVARTEFASRNFKFIVEDDQVKMNTEGAPMIKVAEVCKHTGSRLTGRQLKSVIDESSKSTPVLLDFEGVTMISSSFIDEAMGQLAQDLGEEKLAGEMSVVNASAEVLEVLKMVLGERLAA